MPLFSCYTRGAIGPLRTSYPRAKSPGLLRSCGGPAPLEACQWPLIASPPFLPVLSVSPSLFLQLQPELDKTADQICRELAIFLSGSLSVFALRRIAKLVRFRALAMVSTLFELRTSVRSSLSCSGVQGRRGVPVICPSPPSRRDRTAIVRGQDQCCSSAKASHAASIRLYRL
jgi:hypothetical protein